MGGCGGLNGNDGFVGEDSNSPSYYPVEASTGATQDKGGIASESERNPGTNGEFVLGGRGGRTIYPGGGGGGWYGGAGGSDGSDCVASGSGGSSFISGHS